MTGKVKNKNKKKSQAAAVWRRLKKNKMAVLGLIILAVIIFFAVFADVFFDYETLVIQQNASLKLQPPSVEHWLGTDEVGRDILARIVPRRPDLPAGGLCHHRHCHSGGRPAGGHRWLRQPPCRRCHHACHGHLPGRSPASCCPSPWCPPWAPASRI